MPSIFTAFDCKGCEDAHKVTEDREKKRKSSSFKRVFHDDLEKVDAVNLVSRRVSAQMHRVIVALRLGLRPCAF